MEYITCGKNVGDEVIVNTMRFWAKNTFQHISVLLNAYKTSGAVLQDTFKTELKNIAKDFKELYKELKDKKNTRQIRGIVRRFLMLNYKFIKLLERLKFEGFNGYPVLYETVYHFIYEQEYVAELFKPYASKMNKYDGSVIFNTYLNSELYNQSIWSCIYSNLYFWSLIGAEHTSIIETISPKEVMLPEKTKKRLQRLRNDFNQINYALSELYPDMNAYTLAEVYPLFRRTNRRMLRLLKQFQGDNTKVLPQKLQKELPKLFDGVLQHLIDEHEYIDILEKGFNKYLKIDLAQLDQMDVEEG